MEFLSAIAASRITVTVAANTTLTRAAHVGRACRVSAGPIALPLDTDWRDGDEIEFIFTSTNPVALNWPTFAIVSQDLGTSSSQVIGGSIASSAVVKKISSGVAYLFTGASTVVALFARTVGVNPVLPAIGATANYNFDSSDGLLAQQFYGLDVSAGTIQITAIAGNTVTIQNISATAGTAVPAGTKIAPVAKEASSTAAYEGVQDYRINPANSTAIAFVGAPNGTVSGTISHPSISSSTAISGIRRALITGAATAGTVISIRSVFSLFWRGNTPTRGGYRLVLRAHIDTPCAGHRAFFGIWDSGASTPTNVDPFTNTAIAKFGVSVNTNTGNWFLIHNASGSAPTVTDLGTNFPQTDAFELDVRCLPGASGYGYTITNLFTRNKVSGFVSNNIPVATAMLAPIEWMSNNATAAAISFAHIVLRLTTPN